MRLTIFGTGYVGLVTGACFADVGHHVVCVDIDADKITRLNQGQIPIHEPGLASVVERSIAAGTLEFTTDSAFAVSHGVVQFIAVGTPPDESGAADLQYVLTVARTIADHAEGHKVVVVKSTVPVGTSDKVAQQLADQPSNGAFSFDVVSNPEFLKEGSAVNDFLKPDRIVVGTASERARAVMHEIYEPFNRNHDRMIYMDVRSAELTKYAANAMLATKISFINEMANLAERLGADIEQVRQGIGADQRIGYHFIYPGAGYGGSCFPKDVKALVRTGAELGFPATLIAAVEAVNNRQKHTLYEKLEEQLGRLEGKVIAVWGLAFKPNTDDIREAPSRSLIESLWDVGASVRAYDPVAGGEFKRVYGSRSDLDVLDDKYAALDGADALVICTEWQQFRAPNFEEMAERMSSRTIIDGRNLFAPERMRELRWTYVSVGRQAVLQD
jgi:UDPglucose 6-dehydrogenase